MRQDRAAPRSPWSEPNRSTRSSTRVPRKTFGPGFRPVDPERAEELLREADLRDKLRGLPRGEVLLVERGPVDRRERS